MVLMAIDRKGAEFSQRRGRDTIGRKP